ncbi:MAG: hypothetical protein CL945_04585 [Dinoroseobacter sp.]|jgi:hypothetical protein|nr:hypothetical protein [Dinoroseobacter sp.]|tara:strand:+ start:880 stop:1377 length:498 start_codon:yes stop_codon:yes gene_type:complete
MTYLEELWRSLFSKKITHLERDVMEGVIARFDRDEPVVMLAAILVRMLFLVLIEHKASPFTVLRNFAQAMEENRRATVLITATYEKIQTDLHGLRETTRATQEALAEARELAQAKVGYDPMWGFRPDPSPEAQARFSPLAIATLIAGCCAVSFISCTIAFMIFLG